MIKEYIKLYSDPLKIQLTEINGNRILRSINFALGHRVMAILEAQELKIRPGRQISLGHWI